jgi:methyl-accepting chemotaxis protein/methyl-accepting chemotaxis protein-1 (serine sensor receptor)
VKLDEVAAAIQGVTESAGKVKTLVDEVNAGSQEQARGIEQISTTITQMEQVTQKTAASAEESASAAEELHAQSASMQALVNSLTAVVKAGGGRRPAQEIARPMPVSKPVRTAASAVADPFPMDDDIASF